MTQPAKAQEPSMEEILASIRRIISDDETKPAAASEPPKPESSRAPPKVVPQAKATPRASPAPSRPPVPAQTSQDAVAPKAPAAPSPPVAKNSQDDIDAMLAGLAAETEVAVRVAGEPESDVFELTEQMAISASPAPGQRTASLHQMNDPEDEDPRSAGKYGGYPASVSGRFEEVASPVRPLMSSSTEASVETAFNALANTILSNNARTLEDLVKEMLRPMLKAWLDDNLPNMVERIVRAEIERVSRGR